MNRDCRCGTRLIPVYSDSFAFARRCPACKQHYRQRKRLKAGLLDDPVIRALSENGSKVSAIVALRREEPGLSLADAKERVESIMQRHNLKLNY